MSTMSPGLAASTAAWIELNCPGVPWYRPTLSTCAEAAGANASSTPAITNERLIPDSSLSLGAGILHAGVELERHPRDLDIVAGLKPLGLERPDHADPAQPPLEVSERILVVEVVTRDQPLDPRTADPVLPLPDLPHRVAPVGCRPEHLMLGEFGDIGRGPREARQ